MKRFAVVLCGMDEDVKIKFFEAKDWRDAAFKASMDQSGENPLWNCLDVPDEAMIAGGTGEDSDDDADAEDVEPMMVPLTLLDALQDASNSDMLFALEEVPK